MQSLHVDLGTLACAVRHDRPTLLVDIEHQRRRFFEAVTEELLKYPGYVRHQVDWVVPYDDHPRSVDVESRSTRNIGRRGHDSIVPTSRRRFPAHLAFRRVVISRPLVPSRLTSAFSHVGSRPSRSLVGAYVALTKPRIIELLLITTVPTMVLANDGWPDTWLVVWTVIGGTLAAGGANAINMYIDRDIDQLMQRTRNRPLVTGKVRPRNALLFAIALEIAAFVILAASSNVLAGVLAISATLFYVFIYSLWLKRTSRQNIVIGGAAGAAPVLVGWAAVANTVSWAAVVLFLVIFLWTPPHFWALAIRHVDDYRAASVPMLPVVETPARTVRTMGWYSVSVALTSFALIPLNDMGVIYMVSSMVLGVGFVALTFGLGRTPSASSAMRVFSFSISYITLLFLAVMLDVLVR